MRLNAWVSPYSYSISADEDPQIYAVWTVTYPANFVHDYCYVIVAVGEKGSDPVWYYDGYYVVGSGGGGDVDVYCNSDDGDAQFEWDISEASPPVSVGDYYALVYAEAWEGWPIPSKIIYDDTQTNDFELTV
jgi:hypothetical protein